MLEEDLYYYDNHSLKRQERIYYFEKKNITIEQYDRLKKIIKKNKDELLKYPCGYNYGINIKNVNHKAKMYLIKEYNNLKEKYPSIYYYLKKYCKEKIKLI